MSLGCETWNLSETWESLSISWDKIRFGWECREDTILWTYGLRRIFFFNHHGNKNTNFRVGLCYIKKLKCPKYIQKLRRRRRSISISFEALRCLLKWVCSYWAVYAYNKCLSIFRDPIHLFGLLLIHDI